MRPWIWLGGVGMGVGLLLAGWFAFHSIYRAPAVDFRLISNQKISSQTLVGRVYLVNFWATSCSACIAEMPHWAKLYKKYKDQGLELIAVAMEYDSLAYVKQYSQSESLPFKVAMDDDGQIAQQFGQIELTPTTFLVDCNNRILKKYVGAPDFIQLDMLLNQLLKECAHHSSALSRDS